VQFNQISTSTSKALTGFQLYLSQPNSGCCIYNRGLRRFREMSRGVENGPFSMTNPTSLDISISQDRESICKLYRPFCEFHRLFISSALDIGLDAFEIGILGRGFLCGEIAHTKRWKRQNSSDSS
jgi:hypothetical protein